VTVPEVAKPYRSRRRLVGFSYDPKTQLASLSAYVPGSSGRERKRKTVFAATYDDAIRLWTAFRERVKNRNLRPAVAPFFSEYIAEYFDDVATQVSRRCARDYRYAIDKHLLPFFGNRRLNEITTALVKSFETKLKRRGYALATVNDYLNVLLMLLHRAVDDFDLIEEFPIKKRLKRKRPEALALELTDDERAAFFSAFDGEKAFRKDLKARRVTGEKRKSSRYVAARRFGGSLRPDGEAAGAAFVRFQYLKPLFTIAIETGLRRGDLLRLKWRAIDFANRWIHIVMHKTKLPVTIPISAACYESLQVCLSRAQNGDDVFADENGYRISDTRVRRTFARAKRVAGITRRFRFHDLRHTFGSRLASKNVAVQVISKVMGHTSIIMTMRYARPSTESLRGVQEALDS
jgi:integrase